MKSREEPGAQVEIPSEMPISDPHQNIHRSFGSVEDSSVDFRVKNDHSRFGMGAGIKSTKRRRRLACGQIQVRKVGQDTDPMLAHIKSGHIAEIQSVEDV